MVDYSALVDGQISQMMGFRGRVTVDQLPGIFPEDAAELLRRYAELHPDEGPFVFDGQALSRAQAETPQQPDEVDSLPQAAVQDAGSVRSPVDEVLSAPRGKALLDSAPSGGRVSKWMLALPISLLLPGGLIAWFLVKEENPRAARNLLILGIVMTLLTLATMPMMKSLMPGG